MNPSHLASLPIGFRSRGILAVLAWLFPALCVGEAPKQESETAQMKSAAHKSLILERGNAL
ncbi:MAG: hypothetical protein WD851_15810 [Pirellulales bacterium]